MEARTHLPERAVHTRMRHVGALLAPSVGCAVAVLVLTARAAQRAPVIAGWLEEPRTALAVVRVEQVIEMAAVAGGLVVAGWFAVSLGAAAVCTTARTVGRRWTAGERWVDRYAPGVVRRALLVSAGTGLALAGAGLPAVAAVDDTGVPAELGWSETVDLGPAPATAPAPPPPAPPAATDQAGTLPTAATVTVRPGDTLWDLAAANLPADADASDVAAAWPAWYAANAGVVGDDPDLIHPGQQLVPPTAAATGAPE